MRLTGREQVSHKTLSDLAAELELYGFVEVERKVRGKPVSIVQYTYIVINHYGRRQQVHHQAH